MIKVRVQEPTNNDYVLVVVCSDARELTNASERLSAFAPCEEEVTTLEPCEWQEFWKLVTRGKDRNAQNQNPEN